MFFPLDRSRRSQYILGEDRLLCGTLFQSQSDSDFISGSKAGVVQW